MISDIIDCTGDVSSGFVHVSMEDFIDSNFFDSPEHEELLERAYLHPLSVEDHSSDEDYVPRDDIRTQDWSSSDEEDWSTPPSEPPATPQAIASPIRLPPPIIDLTQDLSDAYDSVEVESDVYITEPPRRPIIIDLSDDLDDNSGPEPVFLTAAQLYERQRRDSYNNQGWRKRVRAPSPEWIKVVHRRTIY